MRRHILQLAAKYGIAVIATTIVLVAAALHSYLLYHTLAELFSALISFAVFLLVWNARGTMKNDFAFFISLALLFTGAFDLFHVFFTEGIGIFPDLGRNEAIQMWLANRYFLSASFLIAPLFLKRKLNDEITLAAFLAVAAIIAQSIFYWKSFPAAIGPMGEPTLFQTISEVAAIALFIAAIFVYRRSEVQFDPAVRSYICVSIALNALAGLFFLVFDGQYWARITGHAVKVLAYFALYKALVEVSLMRPYRTLFFELEKSSRFKDELVSMISHDLKTPVTSIKLVAETLEAQLPEGTKARVAAALITRQSAELGSLVGDFLDYGRIELGKVKLEKTEFSMRELIESCVQTIRPTAPDREITFLCKQDVAVIADRSRIGRIFTNLAANAIKYSPPGSKVEVVLDAAGDAARVSVKDYGRGIKKENLAKVFDKYFRGSDEVAKTEGLGIGLYIVKIFVELHGGRVWAESELGRGSTFHFALPAVREPVVPETIVPEWKVGMK